MNNELAERQGFFGTPFSCCLKAVVYIYGRHLRPLRLEKNFDHIDYLSDGNAKQRRAYRVLTGHLILEKLSPFDPILAGTIPLNIDTEDSDLDIICCYADKQVFSSALVNSFQWEEGFTLWERLAQGRTAVVARFCVEGFAVEVFGQDLPTRRQMAYRHLLIEHRLLVQRGEAFRRQVINLKRKGYKTEPAFAVLLGLEGDPYTELLGYEHRLGGQSH